ncbi:hypothetical protein CDAIGKPJ_02850 [Aeromonas salmonicida]
MQGPQHVAMNKHHQQQYDADIEHHYLPDSGDEQLAKLYLNGLIAGQHQQFGHSVLLAIVVIHQIMTAIGGGIRWQLGDPLNVTSRLTGKPRHQFIFVHYQQGAERIGGQLRFQRCLDKRRLVIP